MDKQVTEIPYRCTVEVTLGAIGGKWKAVILWHLSHKTLRFSQLRRRLPGITQKMLTQQLRELERDGLLHREVFAEVPPRVEYSLTELGRTLRPLLSLMCEWGKVFAAAREGLEAESTNKGPVEKQPALA